MIDLTFYADRLDRAARRARERSIVIPTFEQMRDPSRIPAAIRERLGRDLTASRDLVAVREGHLWTLDMEAGRILRFRILSE